VTTLRALLALLLAWPGLARADEMQDFERAIAMKNDALAVFLMDNKDPKLAEAMRQQVRALCTRKDETACYVVYCKGRHVPGTSPRKEFYTKECADFMGRAYGPGWMEAARRFERDNFQVFVKCEHHAGNTGTVIAFCKYGDRTCEHNQSRDERGLGVPSGFFPDLDQAARDACRKRP